jgi:hypothetical protein
MGGGAGHQQGGENVAHLHECLLKAGLKPARTLNPAGGGFRDLRHKGRKLRPAARAAPATVIQITFDSGLAELDSATSKGRDQR